MDMNIEKLNKKELISLLLELNCDYNVSFLFKTPTKNLRLIIKDELRVGISRD